MDSTWLKPIFLVLGIFAFVYFLMILGTSWDVTWTDMNPTLLQLLPWLVALGIGLFTFVKVVGGK